MAITNHERIGKALDILRQGLGPFVEREFQNVYKGQSQAKAAQLMGEDRLLDRSPEAKGLRHPSRGADRPRRPHLQHYSRSAFTARSRLTPPASDATAAALPMK